MNRSKLLPIVVFVMCFASSACFKIKSTSFVVGGNTASLPGISEDGKLRWLSTETEGFVVHLGPVSPCVGGLNDLPANTTTRKGEVMAEASCKVAKDMDGAYTYSIVPVKPAVNGSAAGDSSGNGYQVIAFHVDYCPLCPPGKGTAFKKRKKIIQLTQGVGPNILIGCDQKGTAYALDSDPSVSAGQVVYWTPLGPMKSTDWQVTVPPGFCKGGKTSFGTIVPGSPVACTIPDNPAVGKSTYGLEYKSTTPTKDCRGTADITVSATQ